MKTYLVTYHAPQEFMEQASSTDPDEMKKGMEDWMAWAAKCGDSLTDMGAPLTGGQKLLPDGESGESTRQIVGYSFLQAENMEEVQNLLKEHPHLAWNGACEIEVHEAMPGPGA